ncbi:MAG: OmpA family protein [Gammaproteobacteria bacterium]|nr:OmpA family protein [Gammaproteobacteria bacterium]
MQRGTQWLSISDMMAGLMMVFLLVAVAFMIQTDAEKASMAEVAQTYQQNRLDLAKALREELQDDLIRWSAEILPDTTVRFSKPEILFDVNSAKLKPEFERILNDFFPRYLGVLAQPVFAEDIAEIRIEGHTSSDWEGANSELEAYMRNMDLSQARSSSVLEYVYRLDAVESQRDWLSSTLRASGMAFAELITDDFGREDAARSRRVEFKVITKTEDRIIEILERAR